MVIGLTNAIEKLDLHCLKCEKKINLLEIGNNILSSKWDGIVGTISFSNSLYIISVCKDCIFSGVNHRRIICYDAIYDAVYSD